MPRIFGAFLLAVFLHVLPANCHAAYEYISFNQAASGDALATIHGDIPFCDPFIGGGFVGTPKVSLTLASAAIDSVAVAGECNPGPAPYSLSVPYQITAALGILTDGQYSVTWTYTQPPFVNPVMTTHAVLSIESGEVVIFRDSFE